ARNATTPTGKPGLVQPKRDQNEENSQRTDWDRIAALVRQSRNVAIRGLRLNTESASASASRPPSSGRTSGQPRSAEPFCTRFSNGSPPHSPCLAARSSKIGG